MSDNSDDTSPKVIREVFRNENGVVIEWTPIHYSLSSSEEEHCKSPKIVALESTWTLALLPNGMNFHFHAWVGLIIIRSSPRDRSILFRLGVKLAGKTEREIESIRLFPPECYHYDIFKLLPRSDLKKDGSTINLTGQLSITFELWARETPILEGGGFFTPEPTANSLAVLSAIGEECSHISLEGSTPSQSDGKLIKKEFVSRESQTEEQSDNTAKEENGANLDTKVDPTLQKHLKDFLLSGDGHDVTIKVGNKEFRAHKGILRARSPVFAAMFKHDMKESEDGSITIEDCDPDAFGEFLNYVYTGKVEDLSPRKATGLYYAGDKYDFSGLKDVCVQFLEASLSKASVCDVINLATKHDEKGLLESAIKFFSSFQ